MRKYRALVRPHSPLAQPLTIHLDVFEGDHQDPDGFVRDVLAEYGRCLTEGEYLLTVTEERVIQ